MSHKHVEFISKNKFPNTYVTLLPTELLELLNAYYFGPLEMAFNYYGGVLTIRYFDSNNNNIVSINVDIVISDLIGYHKLYPTNGRHEPGEGYIQWSQKFVAIGQERTRLAFYDDYKINLFWEKLEQLANTITRLKEQNLSHDAIDLRLTTLHF